MWRRVGLVPAVSFGVLAAVVMLNTRYARGAEDCVAEPNGEPPDGRHWFYHVDPATNRKCWHLGEATPAQRPAPDASAPASAAEPAGRRSSKALSKAEREDLFREFVRWHETQRASR
jgi:hypothetical protein